MNVVITEEAWEDLYQIGLVVKRDSPRRAESLVEELYDSCREIGFMPNSYPFVKSKGSGIRRRVHPARRDGPRKDPLRRVTLQSTSP